MRLLVIGGSGFLGRYVLTEAARRGHETLALARSPAAARLVSLRGARPLLGDLRRPGELGQVFAQAGCGALVSLAPPGLGDGPGIVAAAREAGIGRAVFLSSTAAAAGLPGRNTGRAAGPGPGEPGLAWTILRPAMIYGAPGDGNLSRLLTVLHCTSVLPVPQAGRHRHQPVHVADAASAVIAAAERSQATGACYDLAGPQPLTIAQLLAAAARAVGSRTRFVPMPLTPALLLTRAYEQLRLHSGLWAGQLRWLAQDHTFTIDAAARDLGYRPRPFSDGIRAEAHLLGLAPPATTHSGTVASCCATPATGHQHARDAGPATPAGRRPAGKIAAAAVRTGQGRPPASHGDTAGRRASAPAQKAR